MAKKASAALENQHPELGKSEAIRQFLTKHPDAVASTAISALKKDYGIDISQPLFYQVRGKMQQGRGNGQTAARTVKRVAKPQQRAVGGSGSVVETIEAGRRLITLTGSVEDATAVLRAL